VHNHPSGDPTPSREDVAITRQLRETGDILGVELLDHIILAGQRHVSLKDQGLGF
jgi:DNA repair protein RadC